MARTREIEYVRYKPKELSPPHNLTPAPKSYVIDRKTKGPSPELGEINHEKSNEHSYFLEYPKWKEHPGIELFNPTPPPKEILEGEWRWMYRPLIDRWEADCLGVRWGFFKRAIASAALRGSRGFYQLHGVPHEMGGSITLVETLDIELTALTEDFNDDHPDKYFLEFPITPDRTRSLYRALKDLAEGGYIEVFASTATDPSMSWIIVPTNQLKEVEPYLRRRYPDSFPQRAVESGKDNEEIVIGEKRKPIPESEYQDEFPILKRVSPMAATHWMWTDLHYQHRDQIRWEVPVVPEKEGEWENWTQDHLVVLKGQPAGDEFLEQTGSVQQVSEILSFSPLAQYVGIEHGEGIEGLEDKLKNRHTRALVALHDNPDPRNAYEVLTLLEFLTTDDLIATKKYVEGFIRIFYKKKEVALEKILIEKSGVEQVVEMIELIPHGQGKRHVLRQVNLLVSAILQDVLSLWSGQIVSAWPLPEEMLSDEEKRDS